MNINNCDILMENGHLRLICDVPGFDFPLILAQAHSNHELNEKAMKIFEPKVWIQYLGEQSAGKTTSQVHPLLADIYKNHKEDYMAVLNNIKNDKIDSETCDCPDCHDDNMIGTVAVVATGEVDKETGHRLGRLEIDGLKKMDTDALRALADAFDIEGFDVMPRLSLIFAIHEQDIDMDDSECDYDCEDCEYAEMINDDACICHYEDDDSDECDGDCENCKYDIPETDSGCSCESDENTAQPEAQPQEAPQYEYVNGPAHYHGTECIENMRKLYGDDAVRWFCILSAYKYRFRDGSKPGVSAEQDHEKADWYENYAVSMMENQRYYS